MTHLARSLAARYRTGPRYTTAYLRYFEQAQAVTLNEEADFGRLTQTQQMWFDYAMSTNLRGQDLMSHIEQFRRLSGCRYLDIGCGFGGCLIAAASREADAVGIEIADERIALARENVADAGVTATVLKVDALSPAAADELGGFDLISCNDVAEHVLDVEELVANLKRLLRPGGLVYLEVPNAWSTDFVASDGHFGLFGITLLDRPDAVRYHASHFSFPYDVGHYLTLERYTELLQSNGMEAQLVETLYHPAAEISSLDSKLSALDEAAKVPVEALLRTRYERYRERLADDLASLPADRFRNRYLRRFWTFVATAP